MLLMLLLVVVGCCHREMSRRIYNTWKERRIAESRMKRSSMLLDHAFRALHLRARLSNYVDDDDDDDLNDSIGIYQLVKTAYDERCKAIEFVSKIYKSVEDPMIDWNSPLTRIDEFNESQCILNFCFQKDQLHEIFDKMWPKFNAILECNKDSVPCDNQYRCHYETGFLIILFRLSRPNRLRPDMERFFRIRKSKLSAIIKTFGSVIYQIGNPLFTDPLIFKDKIPLYAEKITLKTGGVINHVWGFINATVRKTARPSRYQ